MARGFSAYQPGLNRGLGATERIGALEVEEHLARLARSAVDVLPLAGEPGLPLPGHVVEVAERALREGETRVPSQGAPQLRRALADRLAAEWGRPVDPAAEILVTNGAMHALSVVLRSLLQRGAHVVVPSPSFFFSGLLAGAGLHSRYVPGRMDDGWAWDVRSMAAAIDARTRAILLCNPENPSGYVPDDEQVLRVSHLAARSGLLLIADESYERFVYDRPRVASFGRLPAAPDTVVVRSLSKSYALSRWRVGYVAAPPRLLEPCRRTFEWDSIRCSHLSQVVAAAAVAGPQDWLDAAVQGYRQNRDLAMLAIPPSLPAARPGGGAFVLVDLQVAGDAGDAGASSAAQELHEFGVPAVAGRHFRAPGHVRIPFGGPAAALPALGRRLDAWLAARAAAPPATRGEERKR